MKKIVSKTLDRLRHKGKHLFDNIKSEQMKSNLLTAIPFWVGSVIAAFAAVFYARLFAFGENLLVKMIDQQEWLLFIIMPSAFVLAWWLGCW